MGSPPPPTLFELQGASRTHGRILRGRAQGNLPNIGDFADAEEEFFPVQGKIHIYVSDSVNPDDWRLADMSRQVLKHPVNWSFATILRAIGDKHSPVRRKFIF